MQGRKRNRKFEFDYSSDAVYFVTICTKDKIHHFGKVTNKEMILNEFGELAFQKILWLENQYPYFEIHNFIVMPNHVHILFEINRNKVKDLEGVKIKSVSSLMGAYKMTVSKEIHLLEHLEFSWQRSFHDHILKSEKRYHIIHNYITKNPENWDKDKFYGD